MTRKSVNLDAQIADYCDKAVAILKKFGIPQYKSRSQYVKDACLMKLVNDGIISEKQVTPKSKKIEKEVSA